MASAAPGGGTADGWVLNQADGAYTALLTVEAASMAELEVDLAPRRLVVRDVGGAVRTLELPFEVEPEACRARFRARRRELAVALQPTGRDLAEQEPGPRDAKSAENAEQQPDTADELTGRVSGGAIMSKEVDAALEELAPSVEPATQPSTQTAFGTDAAAVLAELHEGAVPEEALRDVSEAEGDQAFQELRALLAEGPTAIREGTRRRVEDGRIGVAFCRVLRQNLQHAVEAGQPNKAQAFRRIQQEIRTLLSEAAAVPSEERHAPHIDVSSPDISLSPRLLDPAEVLDATSLHTLVLEDKSGKSKKSQQAVRQRVARLAERVGERLSATGWVVLDGMMNAAEAAAVRAEMEQLEPHFHASEIWVGKQAAVGAQMTMPEIRGDKILWMCGHHPKRSSTPWSHANESQSAADFAPGEDQGALQPCSASVREATREKANLKSGGARRVQPSERWLNRNLARMLDAMDALIWALRESPKAGRCGKLADRSDAMLAVYPATGARFQRHVDNTAGDGRRLTCLCYMNERWAAGDGGELFVHPEGVAPVEIFPIAGRIVLFFADSMPHEVRPSHRHRFSVNVWYYDTEERDRAAREAREKGRVGGQGGAVSDAENAAARGLLQKVLGGGGGRPAQRSDLEELAGLAEALPQGAAYMVAQVTMGSSATTTVTPADVARGLRSMAPEALDALRGDLSVMRRR